MLVNRSVAAVALGLIFAVEFSGGAHAQNAEEFYKGRQIQMVVGYEVGNDYDVGARLLARYLSKELPGNPTVVVQNMPQASGVVAANYMALKAARDGTVIGGISRNLPSQAMMKLPNIEADPRKFIWLGATSFPGRVCVASSAAPVKKAKEQKEHYEVTLSNPKFKEPILRTVEVGAGEERTVEEHFADPSQAPLPRFGGSE